MSETIVKVNLSPEKAGRLYMDWLKAKDENEVLKKQFKALYDAALKVLHKFLHVKCSEIQDLDSVIMQIGITNEDSE